MKTRTARDPLDFRGKSITTYVIYDAAHRLEDMEIGDRLELLTDDAEFFEHDISAWSAAAGHTVCANEPVPGGRRFVIEKGPPPIKETSLAIVISTDGLEELLSPLAFALAAALEGIDVNLYLQGPAVRVMASGFQPKLKGWARPFSRIAAAGMTKSGHIPAQDKLRQLRSLGAAIYMCAGSMDHFKVAPEDLIFDDLPLVEYMTFMAVMEAADIHIFS